MLSDGDGWWRRRGDRGEPTRGDVGVSTARRARGRRERGQCGQAAKPAGEQRHSELTSA